MLPKLNNDLCVNCVVVTDYGPLRHPASPDWPSRVSGGRVHATDRASRVAAFFIFHACWRQYPGRYRSVHTSLASQSANGLPLNNGGSASALSVSRPAQRSLRVPARMVAEPPYAALRHQSASVYIVASVNRPGCYQPERQLLGGVRTRQKKAPFHGARCFSDFLWQQQGDLYRVISESDIFVKGEIRQSRRAVCGCCSIGTSAV